MNNQAHVVLKNLSLVFSEKITTILLGIICTSFIARSLSVEDYGNFQYSIFLLGLFLSITYFCGSEFLTPKLISNEIKNNQIINEALFLRLTFSLISTSILILYIYHKKTNELYLIILPLLIKETFSVALNWFQANSKNYIPSKIQIFSASIKILIIYLLFTLNKISLNVALLIYCAEYCITTLLIFFYFKKETSFKLSPPPFENCLKILRQSWSFGLGVFFMMLLQRIDKFYLKDNISLYEFGLYAAASQITENILMFFTILVNIMAPILIYKKTNYYHIKKSLAILIFITLSTSLATMTFLNLFSSKFFLFVFGNNYDKSALIFLKLTPLIIIYTLDFSISTYFNKLNMGNTIMKKWIFSFFITFILLNTKNNLNINYSIFAITLGYFSGILYSLYSFIKKDYELKKIESTTQNQSILK